MRGTVLPFRIRQTRAGRLRPASSRPCTFHYKTGVKIRRWNHFRPARAGRPRAGEFVFARLRYDSGDWDYNPKVAANVLNSLVEYTTIPVYPEEVVITADSKELLAFPFLFMTGHKLVRFSREEREQLRRFVEHGGFLFSDDCNHDVNGLYAKSFEEEMRTIFPGAGTLAKLPAQAPALPLLLPVSRRSADDLARAERLGGRHRPRLPARRRASRPRRRAVFNKDYGCEWDYDWRNKRFQREDNTKFAVNMRRLRDDVVTVPDSRSKTGVPVSCAGKRDVPGFDQWCSVVPGK